MAQKKYASLSTLQTFLEKLKNLFATKTELDSKANSSHTHTIANVTNLQTTLDGKVPTSRTINSKPLSDDITLTASDVGLGNVNNTSDANKPVSTAQQTAINTSLATAKEYTDTKVAALVNGAPETLNTLDELAAALNDNADIVDVLNDSIATKANASDLTAHTGDTAIHVTSTDKSNWNTAYTHSQAAHARTDATKVADSTTNGNILINGTETNVYTLPSAGSELGGVKSGGDVTISGGVITVNDDSHNHTIANIDNLQNTLDSMQNDIDGKAASGHTHNYAGSSSVGGAATSANKLNVNDGSAIQPVYFANGIPVKTTYTLEKSVPSDALFTDTNTHYATGITAGASGTTTNAATANPYVKIKDDSTHRSQIRFVGSGATTVSSDASGNITISSTDNNTTYKAAGSSLGLVKTGGDVTISSGVITVNDIELITVEDIDEICS